MKQEYEGGRQVQRSVPKIAWQALGFSDSMTIEQARERVRQLNKQGAVARQEASAIARISERVERDRLHHSAFVPEDLNQAFLKWMNDNISGGEKHQERMRIQWSTAKKALIKLQLTPEKFESSKKQIYRYLASQEYSLDYSKKLIRTMNLYGKFVSRLSSRYYDPIPNPKGSDREMINDSYLDSDSYVGASEPLGPDELLLLQAHLKPEQHSWLTCATWFGLRPSELDQILADRDRKFWRVEPGNPDRLWVYQAKLTSIRRDLRWKLIPILFEEQRKALEILISGAAAKPLTKTLKKYLGNHTTIYGGRKAFTDLMLDRGQKLEDISQWMGHTSIDRTWQSYKDRTRVRFTKIK